MIGQALGDGLWEVRGGVSKIRAWGLREDFPERRCPSIAAKDGHQHPPLVMKGMVCGVGLCGVQASLRLREGTLPSLLLLVPLLILLGQDHGKSRFREGQVLFFNSDPQAWCGSPGQILQS